MKEQVTLVHGFFYTFLSNGGSSGEREAFVLLVKSPECVESRIYQARKYFVAFLEILRDRSSMGD